MKILFITRKKWPHIGGVEKHIRKTTEILQKRGYRVTTISDTDIKYPQIKLIGIIYIWYWFFRNRKVIKITDVVHIHDVFIWYFPFCLLYPKKVVVTTIHGLEFNPDLSKVSFYQKRLAVMLSNRTIGIGKFLENYLHVSFNKISYGAADYHKNTTKKDPRKIVYVGRLQKNTGLLKFLNWLDKNKNYKVDFCGDGELRNECKKYGVVHGFTDPEPFLKTAKFCVPVGYLAALEALNAGCLLKLYWNNKIREDYWKMSPFYKLKGAKLNEWAKKQTWEKLANEYINLYNSIK